MSYRSDEACLHYYTVLHERPSKPADMEHNIVAGRLSMDYDIQAQRSREATDDDHNTMLGMLNFWRARI